MKMDVNMHGLVILLILCAEINAFCDDSESLFVAHPKDLSVKEGDDAMFTCIVSGPNPERDFITWTSSPPVPYDAMVINFNPRTKHLTSRIGFANVNRESRSSHTCVLNIVNSQNQSKTCPSKEAKLNVLYFPRKEDLSCIPNTLPNLQENDTISIRCEAFEGNPAVTMSWFLDGINITQRSSYFDNDTQVLVQDLQIHQSFHQKNITCLVANEIHFPSEQIKCIIGPLTVLEKSRVHDNPREEDHSNSDTGDQNTTYAEATELPLNTFSQTEKGQHLETGVINNTRYLKGHAKTKGWDKKTYIYIAAICILGFIALVISCIAAKVLIFKKHSNKGTATTLSFKASKSASPETGGYGKKDISEPIYEETTVVFPLARMKQCTSSDTSPYECDIFKTKTPSDTCSCSSCASVNLPSFDITEGTPSQYASLQSIGSIKDDAGINILYANQGIIQMKNLPKAHANFSDKTQQRFPHPPPLPVKDIKY